MLFVIISILIRTEDYLIQMCKNTMLLFNMKLSINVLSLSTDFIQFIYWFYWFCIIRFTSEKTQYFEYRYIEYYKDTWNIFAQSVIRLILLVKSFIIWNNRPSVCLWKSINLTLNPILVPSSLPKVLSQKTKTFCML